MQIRQWFIHKLGGYATIEEALNDAPQETLDAAVARLYCVVSKNDIFSEANGSAWFAGRELTDAEYKAIIAEADYFSRTTLYKLLMAELKYLATDRIYNKSQTIEDVTWGKLCLFITDAIKSRVNSLKKKVNRV